MLRRRIGGIAVAGTLVLGAPVLAACDNDTQKEAEQLGEELEEDANKGVDELQEDLDEDKDKGNN